MNYEQLEDMLMKLDIPQIERVKAEYEKSHPISNRKFLVMCQSVIGRKRDECQKKEFAELIERIQNENAPSSATNTEQGE